MNCICKRCGLIDYSVPMSIFHTCRECVNKTPEELTKSRRLSEEFRAKVCDLVEEAIVAGADISDLQDAMADLGYGEHVVREDSR